MFEAEYHSTHLFSLPLMPLDIHKILQYFRIDKTFISLLTSWKLLCEEREEGFNFLIQ